MGRGKTLTVEERAKIDALRSINKTFEQIARKIGRSKCVISNYISNRENYGKNRKGRTKFATSDAEKRRILRLASNSTSTARQIRDTVGASASVRTVQRIIKKSPTIKRMKLKKKPALKERHIKKRLEFGKIHMTWNQEWRRVVFTDEKKFNLDGPDGFRYYFHDIRKDELILSRRHQGGGLVMVWGAICYDGPVELQFLEGSLTALKYLNILQNQRQNITQRMGGADFIFQHDNAPSHSARVIREWIQQENITVMEWPALSPDLNLIENIWGWLSRTVYASGRQFENVEDLKTAIMEAWSSIPQNVITSLYDSMCNRIFELISKQGGHTHY